MINNKFKELVIVLSVLAALLYNFWLFGFILDPGLLKNSYASILEVPGKPYAWLFTITDILAGILAVLAGLLISRLIKLHNRKILAGYIIFGVATFIDAIIPISSRCESSISACGISPEQVLSLHDIASLVAAFGLYASLLINMRL